MKSVLFVLVFLAGFGLLTGCDDSVPDPSGAPPQDQSSIVFSANYVHTQASEQYVPGTWIGDIEYPVVTVISTRAELEQYSDDFSGMYDFLRHDYSPTGFLDAIENYTSSYFSDKFLVLILLEETSGSYRHRVDGVSDSGEIKITRLMSAGAVTADMAQWHIIIELYNDDKAEEYDVVFLNGWLDL
ncbi:MAG: hypothetical protein FWG77_12315 [Treponema sp.]|nr:hypothetical protein [Treponema sp.]